MYSSHEQVANALVASIIVGIRNIREKKVSEGGKNAAAADLRALIRVYRVAEYTAAGEGDNDVSIVLGSIADKMTADLDEALAAE